MSISRISKAIAVARQDQKFQDAEDVRRKDVDVFLPPATTETVHRMAQTVVALILRSFTGQIRFHVTAPMSPSFRLLLESEARKAGASERLVFAPNEAGPWCLALGHVKHGAISADASGWTARINGAFADRMPAAAPAITFAVACAVAKLFNYAIFGRDQNVNEVWDFCLLRFQVGENAPIAVNDQTKIGRIGLLGAGAIGSSVGYVLSISSWLGEVEVIDFDIFEEPNLETCVFADTQDVNRPLRKALALVGSLSNGQITASERRCKLKSADPILQERWEAFVCAVDNPETRRLLDDIDARILLNAGTGSTKYDLGWVLWTQHEKDSAMKLSSVYKEDSEAESTGAGEVPEEFRDACSRTNYQGVDLALPFVALVAGSLLAAGLFQNAVEKKVGIAYLQIDLFGKQQKMTIR